MIDRRAFLRRLGFGTVAAAAAASGVLYLEKLLWLPGEKTIFLPPAPTIITTRLDSFFQVGDIFTINGSNAVNPLQRFVVTGCVGETIKRKHTPRITPVTYNWSKALHVNGSRAFTDKAGA